jgi:outer membrane protein
MRRSLFVLSFCTFTCLSPLSWANSSIQEALVNTYRSNPNLESERANLRAIDEQYFQAISGFLPNISAQYERSKTDTRVGVRRLEDELGYTKRFVATQPLFNGGETISRIKQAVDTIQSGQQNLKRIEQNTLEDAVKAYTDLHQSYEVIKQSSKNVEALAKQLKSVELRFSLGELTRTDVAQAKSALSRAKTDEISAKGQLETAKANYKRVIGLEAPKTISSPPLPVNLPTSLEETIRLAKHSHPALLGAAAKLAASKHAVSVNKARLLPEAQLQFERRETKDSFNFGANPLDSTEVRVNVTAPLYQSGAEYSAIRASESTVERDRFAMRAIEDNVEQEAIKSWEDFQAAKAKVQSTKDAVEAATIALAGITRETEVGLRTVLDMLTTERDLFVARLDHERAKRDHVVTAYSLRSAVGTLTAGDLKLDTPIYDPVKHYNRTKWKLVGWW